MCSFIAYRALPHLNLKHTLFGRVIDDPSPSSATLNRMELHPVHPSTNRPEPEQRIKEVTVFVDPFEEFLDKKRKMMGQGEDDVQQQIDKKEAERQDDQVTWTGKRVRRTGDDSGSAGGGGVGKYLKAALAEQRPPEEGDEVEEEPVKRKKIKGRSEGFGDFSSW